MTDKIHNTVKKLDVTGLLCPMPVLRTRRFLDDLKPGEKLVVSASDPASMHDMPAFCNMAGHTLLMARKEAEVYIFEIEKAAKPPTDNRAASPRRVIRS